MPKVNLQLFETLIFNFAYIHSKRRKLAMFILFQKCNWFIETKKFRHQFANFLHFQFLVTIIKRKGTRKPQD